MKRPLAPIPASAATALSPSLWRRPAITTRAPRRAKARAAARPIPVAPPVTRTTLSLKSCIRRLGGGGHPRALDDGPLVEAGRQAAIGRAAIVAQARRAERVGHRSGRMADQQARLQ